MKELNAHNYFTYSIWLSQVVFMRFSKKINILENKIKLCGYDGKEYIEDLKSFGLHRVGSNPTIRNGQVLFMFLELYLHMCDSSMLHTGI